MHTTAIIIGTIKTTEHTETKGQSPKPLLTVVIETEANERGYSDLVALQTTKPEKFASVGKGQKVAASYRAKSREWQGKYFHDLQLLELEVLSAGKATKQTPAEEYEPEMPF